MLGELPAPVEKLPLDPGGPERVTERGERLLWLAGVGDDLVAPYFAAGADGFTSSLACFWPEAAVELYRLASTGDFDGLRTRLDMRARRWEHTVPLCLNRLDSLDNSESSARK